LHQSPTGLDRGAFQARQCVQAFPRYFYHANKSAIGRAIQRIEILARPLVGVGRGPKVSRADAEALIVDCTALPIRRHGTDATQRQH
jgi:hypothetical protein